MGQLSRSKLILILAFLIPSSLALSTRSRKTEQGLGELYASRPDETLTRATRRQILSFAASVTTFGVFPGLVSAFPNKISDKYDDRPKRKGPQPKDLGVATRKDMIGEEYMGLKNCGPAPNCFCSTDAAEDDPEHYIPAWVWPKNLGKEAAFHQLEETISSYKPGQGNIDGGGFEIITSKPGYLYCQFESLKNGYIDDFEVAFINGQGENMVQVRSSSRVGYLDYGVNAKRINYIAKALREKGWIAEGVDLKNHAEYTAQNQLL